MFNNNWTIDGDEVRVNIPFAKVNKQRRTVSGFATLDNVDTHGDVVDADASVAAFSRFRGNLREMHQPLAVGKVVDFVPQEFEDSDTGTTYKGIFVTAYISKGAQDTWEKVLDGTLSGFSVGGVIKKKEANKSAGGYGSIIKEYDLIELSLVDNPANQLANVFSIQKIGDTTVASGIAVDTKVMNIHYNHDDDIVVLSEQEERDGFENIGWVEDSDSADTKMETIVTEYKKKYLEGSLDRRIDQVREAWYKAHRPNNNSETSYPEDSYEYVMSVFDSFVVTRDDGGEYRRYNYSQGEDGYEFSDPSEVEVKLEISEKAASTEVQGSEASMEKHEEHNNIKGGANVATEEKNDETVEEVEETEEETTEEEAADETEKAASVEEVAAGTEVDVDAIVKAVSDSVTAAVTEVAEKSAESVTEAKDSLTEALDNFKKDVESKLSEIDERVSTVETGSAVRKSADVVEDDDDEDDDQNEDNFWRGQFLSSTRLA